MLRHFGQQESLKSEHTIYNIHRVRKKEAAFFLHNFNKCGRSFEIVWHEPSRGIILLRK